QTQGQVLRTHVESTVAGSTVKGDGEWRLEGGYPRHGALSFSKLGLADLKARVFPGEESKNNGAAAGGLRVEGPLLNWRAGQAELRIPALEIGPAPQTELASKPLRLHNQDPILARFANGTVTVESARFVGTSTDLALTGRVLTQQAQPLD